LPVIVISKEKEKKFQQLKMEVHNNMELNSNKKQINQINNQIPQDK
jgi:hypothetical protein